LAEIAGAQSGPRGERLDSERPRVREGPEEAETVTDEAERSEERGPDVRHDLSEELLRLRAVESCRHAILRNPRSIAVPPEGGPDRPGTSARARLEEVRLVADRLAVLGGPASAPPALQLKGDRRRERQGEPAEARAARVHGDVGAAARRVF